MTRKECLDAAAGCVLKDRNASYGGPEDSFGLISSLWSAYLGVDVDKVDVAMMMGMLKMARIRSNKGYADGFVDLAGYAACGAECADGKPAPKIDEELKFKHGDRVQANIGPNGKWEDMVYYCKDFAGNHLVGFENAVSGGDILYVADAVRSAPKTEEEPKFKHGDRVQFRDEIPSTSEPHWFDGTYVERLPDGGHAVKFGPHNHVIYCSDKEIRLAPKEAEGCEDLVCDAPQTKEDLMERIAACNPATYGVHIE